MQYGQNMLKEEMQEEAEEEISGVANQSRLRFGLSIMPAPKYHDLSLANKQKIFNRSSHVLSHNREAPSAEERRFRASACRPGGSAPG